MYQRSIHGGAEGAHISLLTGRGVYPPKGHMSMYMDPSCSSSRRARSMRESSIECRCLSCAFMHLIFRIGFCGGIFDILLMFISPSQPITTSERLHIRRNLNRQRLVQHRGNATSHISRGLHELTALGILIEVRSCPGFTVQ